MDLFTDREAEVDRLCASLAPQSSDMEDLQTQDSPPSASRDEEPSLEAANTSLLQEKVHELVLHRLRPFYTGCFQSGKLLVPRLWVHTGQWKALFQIVLQGAL